ncbi:MAG: hypothetical protein NVSMB2_20630 [Chloroflexota bacterium]
MRGALVAIWLMVSSAVAPVGLARQSGACDDLSAQIDTTRNDLDHLKNQSLPLLAQAQQLAAIAPGDTAQMAVAGVSPILTPETAGTYAVMAALIGARVGVWQSAHQDAPGQAYWANLGSNAFDWYTTFVATTAPAQPFVPTLAALNAVLSDLQQLGAEAQADDGLLGSLEHALNDCEASDDPQPMPSPPPATSGGGGNGIAEALCSVGGTTGHSNTDCFGLEMDAALAVWTACTEAYFAAESEAFRTGGDAPANNCDGPWHAQIDALQARWGHP